MAIVQFYWAIIVSVVEMKILPAKVEQLSQGLCFTYMSQLTTRSREHSSSSLAGWSVSERQPCLVRGGERHGEEEEEEEEALRINLPVCPG